MLSRSSRKPPPSGFPRALEEPRPQRGFALLITITLLAFLVLLLVSLAALTRVETQVAGNSRQLAQARQNALLALNLALGQLQKTTGPDRRVTARAEILDTNPVNRDSGGAPVVDGVPNPYWTGVWDSSVWSPLDGKYNGTLRGRVKPAALAWLVSGSETPASAPLPATTVTGGQPLVYGVKTDGSADAGNPRVVAPLVPLTSDAVAGLSGTQTVGHYAWWVGDEGIKARLDAIPPESVASQTAPSKGSAASAPYYWKAMMPTRAGAELIAYGSARSFPDFDATAATTSAGAALREGLRHILDTGQLPLLQADGASTGILPAAGLRRHSPDISSVSRGVLADTVRGGLRLDLGRYLETGTTDGAFDAGGPLYQDAVDANVVTGGRLPSFSLLKSWYDIGAGLSGAGFASETAWQSETVSGNVVSGMGVTPIVTQIALALCPAGDGVDEPVKLLYYPIIALWNPHNIAIAATDLVCEFDEDTELQIAVEARKTINNAAATPSPKRYLVDGTVPYKTIRLRDHASTNGPLRVLLKGVRLAPGQSVIYTPGGGAGTRQNALPSGSPNEYDPDELPVMESQWDVNPRSFFVRSISEVTLDASVGPPAADERLMYFWRKNIATDPARPTEDNRLLVKLYVASGFSASARPLVELRTPYTRGVQGRIGNVEPLIMTTGADAQYSVSWTSSHDPQFPRVFSPPSDNISPYHFITTANRLRLPLSGNLTNGVPTEMAAVPFAHLNFRSAYTPLTSLESMTPAGTASAQIWDTDPFYGWAQSSLGVWLNNSPFWSIEDGGDSILAFSGPTVVSGGQGNYYTLFDYPRAATAVSGSRPVVLSLGELQHADLSSTGTQPAYVLGNSLPDPRIVRDKLSGLFKTGATPANAGADAYVRDASYLANHALWDRFFLSTVPQSGSLAPDADTRLPNSRLRILAGSDGAYPAAGTLRNVTTAAAHLALEGAFNVNSTSVDAWRALLGGLSSVPVPAAGPHPQGGGAFTAAGSDASTRHNYSRFLFPQAPAYDSGSASFAVSNTSGIGDRAAWLGTRYLSDADIDVIARNLVEEVKVRGPFMSVADFVNRRLIASGGTAPSAANFQTATDGDLSTDSTVQRLKVGAAGALHKAILNYLAPAEGPNASLMQPVMSAASNTAYGGTANANPPLVGNTGSNLPGWRAFTGSNPQRELQIGGNLAQLSFGAPGFLTQADLLQKIGPLLAARSDTFLIRAYGDVRNPVTTATEGKAWLEAVVQRMPAYVDASQDPDAGASASGSASLNTANQSFGRRYHVVSFRWLTEADL